MPNTKNKFMGSVKISADIAAKQATIKKPELFDLKSVYGKIGDYAHLNQIGLD